MKQFVCDGKPIASDVPSDYPGPLEFFTAAPKDMPKLLVEATGRPIKKALKLAARNKSILAISADEHWIAMINRTPIGQFWVDIMERAAGHD